MFISQSNKKGLRNPWFLGIIGMIGVVLSVNAAYIWLAMKSRPALVDREYSTKDRKSDTAALHDIEAHRSLAWKATIKRNGLAVMNKPVAYEIAVVDRAGAPVSGMMEVEAYRASDASQDFTTAFRETSSGNYQGYIDFPLKGYWELRIRIKRGEDKFEVNTGRFSVAPAP